MRTAAVRWSMCVGMFLMLGCAAAPFDPASVLVEQNTVVVFGLDLSGIDENATGEWIVQHIASQVSDSRWAQHPGLRAPVDRFASRLSALRQAGVQRIYLYQHMSAAGPYGSFALLPRPGSAVDAGRIRAILEDQFGEQAKDVPLVVLDGAFVEAHRSRSRREINEGFEWDKGAFQVVVLPTPKTDDTPRFVGVSLGPAFARQKDFGLILRQMDYMTVVTATPPEPAVRINVRAKDAAGATFLAESIRRLLAAANEASPAAEFPSTAEALKRANVTVEGTKIRVLALDQAGVELVMDKFLRQGVQAGERAAARVLAESNVLQLLSAMLLYTLDEQGKFPDELLETQSHVPTGSVAEYLVNPLRPEQRPGFIYVKPTELAHRLRNSERRLVIHEAFDKWPGGVNVGFADGHVEWIDDQAKFEKLLKEAKEAK